MVIPGEVHAIRDPEDRQGPGTYRVLYAAPELLRQAAPGGRRPPDGPALLPELAIEDAELVEAFLRLHWTLERPSTRLERDVGLVSLLACLVARHADTRVAGPAAARSHRAVELARDYLEDNYQVNVSLQELARVASLSPSQLVRVFRAQVGLPPHAYQLQAGSPEPSGCCCRAGRWAASPRRPGSSTSATSPVTSSGWSGSHRAATPKTARTYLPPAADRGT